MRRLNGKTSKRRKTDDPEVSDDDVDVKEENGTADDNNDAAGEEEEAEGAPGPSRRSRGRPSSGKKTGKTTGKKGRPSGKKAKKEKVAPKPEVDDEEEYEVEAVVGQRFMHGKKQYRVRWQNHGPEEDTWCGETELHCPDLVREYLRMIKETEGESSGTNKKAEGKKRKAPAAADGGETDEEEYEVEKLLEVKFKKNGKREFLVRWKGWGSQHDTWEPEDHLSCTELMEKLLAKAEKAKEMTERELRTKPKQTARLTFDNPQLRASRRQKKGGRVMYHDLLD